MFHENKFPLNDSIQVQYKIAQLVTAISGSLASWFKMIYTTLSASFSLFDFTTASKPFFYEMWIIDRILSNAIWSNMSNDFEKDSAEVNLVYILNKYCCWKLPPTISSFFIKPVNFSAVFSWHDHDI